MSFVIRVVVFIAFEAFLIGVAILQTRILRNSRLVQASATALLWVAIPMWIVLGTLIAMLVVTADP